MTCLKNDSFHSLSQLLLLKDNNLIYGALSDLKLCRMFSFTWSYATHYM